MNLTESKFDVAMEQLDKIANQLERGLISKNDFDTQRLIILVELTIKAVNEFHEGE